MKRNLQHRLCLAGAALLFSVSFSFPACASSLSGELEAVTDSVICGWIRNETGSPASVRITVARESDPGFHHVETINGVPSEEGEGVFFSWEIDWEAYVSDRYLVTAQVLDGDTWKSLSGTYLYDRSEGEGIRLVKETAGYLIRSGRGLLVFKLVIDSGCKYMGYLAGKRYKRLPRWLILRCTMNRNYWRENDV